MRHSRTTIEHTLVHNALNRCIYTQVIALLRLFLVRLAWHNCCLLTRKPNSVWRLLPKHSNNRSHYEHDPRNPEDDLRQRRKVR